MISQALDWLSSREELTVQRVKAKRTTNSGGILSDLLWEREKMKISRDADGLRFIGECTPKMGFVAGDVLCVHCGHHIDPHGEVRDISLMCTGCGIKFKSFWAEADMH